MNNKPAPFRQEKMSTIKITHDRADDVLTAALKELRGRYGWKALPEQLYIDDCVNVEGPGVNDDERSELESIVWEKLGRPGAIEFIED